MRLEAQNLLPVDKMHSVDTASRLSQRVTFQDPPLKELALAVGIEPVRGLNTVKMLDLWTSVFRDRYPIVEEQPISVRLENESFDSQAPPRLGISPELFEPNPRLWLLDAERRHLIQLQRDLFARNWRKEESQEVYPGFPELQAEFRQALEEFDSYVREAGLGTLRPLQVEVSYINHIPESADERLTLSGLVKTVRDVEIGGLPSPEDEQYGANYVIGDKQGRLRIAASTARHGETQGRILVLNLLVRGAPAEPTIDSVLRFMQVGSDVATQAFLDLTTESIQARWRRS